MYRDENILMADPETETFIQTDYETDRNKPIPNILHGVIQANLGSYLKSKYGNQFLLASEVTLELSPRATPDILIFEKRLLDWHLVEARKKTMPITTIETISPSQHQGTISGDKNIGLPHCSSFEFRVFCLKNSHPWT